MTHMTRILGSHGTSSDWENNFFITHFHFYLENAEANLKISNCRVNNLGAVKVSREQI